MAFWRAIFLFSNLQLLQFNEILIYVKSFYVALRLDAVVASYLSLPVFLTIFLPYIGWKSKLYKRLFFIFIGIIAFLYSFISIVDIEFYKELGTHLNILSWQSTVLSWELWQFVWVEYPVIYYLFSITSISYLWYKLLTRIIQKQKQQFDSFFSSISFFIIGFLLIGTLIRGGWQQRPIDWGHAMFSDNPFANQTALNPLFNLGRSVIQLNSEKNIAKLVKYMDNNSAILRTQKTIKTNGEIFTDSSSFKRKIIKSHMIKPNIVLVVLESFLGKYCGSAHSGEIDVTPNLNRMADNGINCTRTIASGKRSAYGLSTILCSWPPLPGFPLISQIESQQDVETVASLLKDIGYSTWFMYGGDADFDNMKGFVLANGFDYLIEQNDFPINTPGTMWGVFDEYLFDYAESILDTSQVPVLLTMFTTTNHQPWKIPKQMEEVIPHFLNNNKRINKVMRTMAYTDYIIGEFIENNRSESWFQNTIFVFISDHGINEYSGMYEDPRNAHIPFIIYSPAIITKPKRINEVTSHIDVVPTLLHLIGYTKPFELLGANILSDDYKGIACRIVNDHCIWIEGNYLYTETFNQNTALFQYSGLYDYPYSPIPEISESYKSIQANFHAYIQSAYFQFKK